MILQEETHKPKEIDLKDLSKQPKYQRIIVTAKVISVDEIKVLDDYGKQQLQTVVIRDKTGEAKFDLWQKHIGTLTLGKTYVISNAMVKIYNEQHSLTTPKDDTLKVEEAEDIPSVIPIKTKRSLCNAQVIGVRTLKSKILCVACSNGDITLSGRNLSLGTCTKCAITVLVSACAKETSADLVIKSQTFCHHLTVKGDQLAAIAGTTEDTVTEEKLLTARTFDCEYENTTVTNVTRK